MAATVGTLISSTSWAAATTCVTVGTGAPTLKLAVASNFYGPAQTLAQNFINDYGGTVSAVLVCQNSTSQLYGEILNGTGLPSQLLPDPGFPRYDYFFAANSATPISLQGMTGVGTAYLYAYGIPVLYSSTNLNSKVSTVGDLITGLGAATNASITGTSLSEYQINANAQYVALADPLQAPYGVAAQNITTAMGYEWNGDTPPTPPVLPSLFANVDVTFSAVGTTVSVGADSGSGDFVGSAIVGKSQICPNLGSVEYVQFPSFQTTQYAIELTTGSVTTNFDSFVRGQIDNGTWNTFLSQNCYEPINNIIAEVPAGKFVAPGFAVLALVIGMFYANRRSATGSPGAGCTEGKGLR